MYVMDADGTGRHRISRFQGFNPAWSPDGSLVAFGSRGRGHISKIYAARPDGSGQHRLTGGATCFGDSSPSWSSHSQHIVFQRDECDPVEVWSLSRYGNQQTNLSGQADFSTVLGAHPRWSPEGEKIAMERADSNELRQIFVMDRDGQNKTQLTFTPEGSGYPAEAMEPEWAPSSDGIAYTKLVGGPAHSAATESNICSVSLLPGSELCLTEAAGKDEDPHYSPSGALIAFISNRSGNWNIYVMDADGTNEHAVAKSSSLDFYPRWSPNGRWIAFLSDRGHQRDIFLVHPDGSGLRRVTNNAGRELEIDWRPF
jgi:TolB protein